MAVEAIMQIFLMIAVLVVAVSFLLKAFNIDLFGFLEELLNRVGVPREGKAVHIKLIKYLDKESKFGVSEFHLTNQNVHIQQDRIDIKSRFQIDTVNFNDKNSCIIFTTKEEKALFDVYVGYIYYVNPGTEIQSGCGDYLGKCIEGKIAASGCDATTEQKSGKFTIWREGTILQPKVCDKDDVDDRFVEKQRFSQLVEDFKDTCGENRAMCDLVKDNSYEVKYGLICGGDGKWHTCNNDEAKKDKRSTFSGDSVIVEAKCENEQSGEYYIWKDSSISSKPTAKLSINPTTQVVNREVAIAINAEDKTKKGIKSIQLNLDDEGDKTGKCEFASQYSGIKQGGRIVEYPCSNGDKCEATWSIKCSEPSEYKFKAAALGDKNVVIVKTNVASVNYQPPSSNIYVETNRPIRGQALSIRATSDAMCTNVVLESEAFSNCGEPTCCNNPTTDGKSFGWEWICRTWLFNFGTYSVDFKGDQSACSASTEITIQENDPLKPITTINAPSEATLDFTASFSDEDQGAGADKSGVSKCYYSVTYEATGYGEPSNPEDDIGISIENRERNCNTQIPITVGPNGNCKKSPSGQASCTILGYAIDKAGNKGDSGQKNVVIR